MVKIFGHSHRVIGDIVFEVCHVILKNHVVKDSCGFIGMDPLRQVIVLSVLVAIGTLVGEI